MRSSVVIVAVLAAGACKPSNDPPPAKPDPAFAAESRKKADELDRIRRDVLAKAWDDVVPRQDLGECPLKNAYPLSRFKEKQKSTLPSETIAIYDLPDWDPSRRDGGSDSYFGPNHKDDFIAGIDSLGIATKAEMADKPGPRWFDVYHNTRPGEVVEASTRTNVTKALDTTTENVDYQLVIIKELPAKITAPGELEQGVLAGIFMAYDHSKKAVVCKANVIARSGDNINVKHNANDSEKEKQERRDAAMKSDLREQAIIEAVKSLYVAGPKPKLAADDDSEAKDGGAKDAGAKADAGAKKK